MKLMPQLTWVLDLCSAPDILKLFAMIKNKMGLPYWEKFLAFIIPTHAE